MTEIFQDARIIKLFTQISHHASISIGIKMQKMGYLAYYFFCLVNNKNFSGSKFLFIFGYPLKQLKNFVSTWGGEGCVCVEVSLRTACCCQKPVFEAKKGFWGQKQWFPNILDLRNIRNLFYSQFSKN